MKISEIPRSNRPRERLKRFGVHNLSDAELLAIILQTGTSKENVVDMCNRLLMKHALESLSGLTIKELQQVDGIGPAKAMQIAALFELSGRSKSRKVKSIRCAHDVFSYFKERLNGLKKENFIVLMLDTRNNIISEKTISVGTLDAALIHPREVFAPVIKESSAKIILVHNHPSGDPTPSEEDLDITKTLIESGELLSIPVLDHVIIGSSYWSYAENR